MYVSAGFCIWLHCQWRSKEHITSPGLVVQVGYEQPKFVSGLWLGSSVRRAGAVMYWSISAVWNQYALILFTLFLFICTNSLYLYDTQAKWQPRDKDESYIRLQTYARRTHACMSYYNLGKGWHGTALSYGNGKSHKVSTNAWQRHIKAKSHVCCCVNFSFYLCKLQTWEAFNICTVLEYWFGLTENFLWIISAFS